MRRGLTLLELLLAIIISSLILGISLPRFAEARDRLVVNEEVWRIVSAHRRARITAILESQEVVLSVAADSLSIRTTASHETLWREAGPSFHGVELAGGSKQITFSPVGITTGVSNASFALSRGQALRTIVVSRLGRLRVQ
jgi:prepilin-type N-terminal cleavage/methylation domain-containing protein